MHLSLFWHSALPLQTCAWPCIEEALSVGQVLAQCVFALVDVAAPQHTCPEGQSLAPSQLKAAVSRGHIVPCATHLPVGLFWASSPTQQVSVRRSQLGVEPHGAMVGPASAGRPGAAASLTDGLPASPFEPELDPEPELESRTGARARTPRPSSSRRSSPTTSRRRCSPRRLPGRRRRGAGPRCSCYRTLKRRSRIPRRPRRTEATKKTSTDDA